MSTQAPADRLLAFQNSKLPELAKNYSRGEKFLLLLPGILPGMGQLPGLAVVGGEVGCVLK